MQQNSDSSSNAKAQAAAQRKNNGDPVQIKPCKLPHRRIKLKHDAHGFAALVRLVEHTAVVGEGSGLASSQFAVAHKEMDVDAQSGVTDDVVAAFAGRFGGVLALPVKVRVIDPVVHVLVLVSPALFVERDQQDVRLFLGQHHMAR